MSNNKPRSRRIALTIAGVVTAFASLTFLATVTSASHSESYVFPGAPYSGTWNLGNYAPPASHHRPWAGNWATDFYQVQYTQGILRLVSNDGTPYAIMSSRTNSCRFESDYAGEAYKFDVYDSSGNRGWLEYAHVSNWDPVGYQTYYIVNGNVLVNGSLVGWVAYWGMGQGVPAGVPSDQKCYDVSFNSSNHWHVEMKNSPAVGHNSCYYNYPSSDPRGAGDWLGIAGANTTTAPAPC